MTIALVSGQIASALVTAATTITVTLPNNPTLGNFVVFCASSIATVSSVKDSNGNTYAATAKTPFGGTTAHVGIWYLQSVPANGTKTITLTQNSGNIEAWAAEFSGVLAASPFENDASANSAANNTAITTPSYTSVADGVLYIAVCAAGTTISTANSPWTGIDIVRNGNYAEFFVQSAHGPQAVNYTQSPSGAWSGLVAAFKPAASTFTYFPMTQPDMAGLLRKAEMVGY